MERRLSRGDSHPTRWRHIQSAKGNKQTLSSSSRLPSFAFRQVAKLISRAINLENEDACYYSYGFIAKDSYDGNAASSPRHKRAGAGDVLALKVVVVGDDEEPFWLGLEESRPPCKKTPTQAGSSNENTESASVDLVEELERKVESLTVRLTASEQMVRKLSASPSAPLELLVQMTLAGVTADLESCKYNADDEIIVGLCTARAKAQLAVLSGVRVVVGPSVNSAMTELMTSCEELEQIQTDIGKNLLDAQ